MNGGGAWGSQDPLNLITNRFDHLSNSISGGLFGGTIGAQVQVSYVVLGLEADLDWANIKGSSSVIPTVGGYRSLHFRSTRRRRSIGKTRQGCAQAGRLIT